jgi:hypothetical protein
VDESVDTPQLKVVAGSPTAEELAALVTVLAVRSAPSSTEPPPVPSLWRDHTLRLGLPPRPGPRAWRASGLPR